jgi:hypothetical protein
MNLTAIVYVDDKPIRAFRDGACIFNAYKWCHREYYLSGPECPEPMPLHKLPDWIEVKMFMLTDEQFNELVKN